MIKIEIACERIRQNAAAVVQMCAAWDIEVVGVTKACCGHPDVARAMLDGGVSYLADSRLKHVRRLREAGIQVPTMLLRLPSLREVGEVVRLTQISLNSELETVRALSQAAQTQDCIHQVILMLETGDRREGVMPDEAVELARVICQLPHIELAGIGTNLGCVGGVMPTTENMERFVDFVKEIEAELGFRFRVVSGGHTENLGVVARGEVPARINQLRIGTAILQGESTVDMELLPCPHRDTFSIIGDVIEVKTKPSLPDGPIGVDAFGRMPQWEDLGPRRRAIVAMGKQDLHIDGLHPKRPGVTLVGASSDHLVLDVTEADPPVRVGDELAFHPSYAALATAMASFDVVQVVKPSAYS